MSNNSPTYDHEQQQVFIQSAAGALASLRSVLLIAAQTADTSNLSALISTLARSRAEANVIRHFDIADLLHQCEFKLKRLIEMEKCPSSDALEVLDLIARAEAALWTAPLRSRDFLSNISDFVDSSFGELVPSEFQAHAAEDETEQFEIDEETMEIFRGEATYLLANMSSVLEDLTRSPADQNAVWELRRHAHTFKGAAGIVGLRDASQIAHNMEDLLDAMAEKQRDATPDSIAFLKASAGRLDGIVNAGPLQEDPTDLNNQYKKVMKWVSSAKKVNADRVVTPEAENKTQDTNEVKRTTSPIVRVSVERLDEIMMLAQNLARNWSAAMVRYGELHGAVPTEALSDLGSLLKKQRVVTDELKAALLQVRMVRFGTLITRLGRAVNVTAIDEKKKAMVEIENGEVEIDTLMIDTFIEPLLHLLKNSVVHGIEPPETRRLIGKDETGRIHIKIEADKESIMLTVSDDGSGISIAKLKEKAIASGKLTKLTAAALDDLAALDLIFDKGLTTAEKVDLNAGRGVGMSIVKESVESRGGTVLVESRPQQGVTFTIMMPLTASSAMREDLALPESATPLVMVVDDSPSIRHQTAKLVSEAGFRVVSASDGAEAVEILLAGEHEPGLILSDVEMPQVDGWELLHFIKTDSSFGNIPVVMVTSLDTEQHRRRAFDLGAFDYVVKPFKEDDLELILRNLPNLAPARNEAVC